MYSFFIGCDVSKAYIDVAYFNVDYGVYVNRYPNDIEGFKRMVIDLERITQEPRSEWFFCFENTGVYSKNLLMWLFSQEINCIEESPLKISKSLGLRRGKEDKADSKAISRYAFEKRGLLKPSIPSKSLIISLKSLTSRRSRLIRLRTIITNAGKALDPGLPLEFEKGFQLKDQELLICLNKQIDELDKSIEQVLRQNSEVEQNAKLLRSIIGIGPITVANMIALSNNFKDFDSARKFACYSGVAPFPNSSGTRKGRTKTSKMANKQMNSALTNGALSAIVHDPELKRYYQRKLAEGKHTGIALNNVKNKLIQRAFAVINRQTPFVKTHKYAS